MATTRGMEIDTEANQLTIQNLTVRDQGVVEYFDGYETDEQEDAFETVIRVGVATLELSETTKDVEHVRKEFESMQSEFESEIEDVREELQQKFGDEGKVSRILNEHLGDEGKLSGHIEEAFGEDGPFKNRLDKELGEDGERIRVALDPDTEGTPTYRLKQTFKDEIDKIREQLAEQKGAEEVREETPLKGYDFEETVEVVLRDVVSQTSNRVEDTSEKQGAKGDSKKGDFVVTLDETDQRIAVEAKNGKFIGTVKSEMEEAIENRDADYGIFVASSIEYLPRTRLGWFSEVDQDFVVVALSDVDEEEIEPRFLKFAYHWARTKTILSYVEINDDIDSERVKAELDGIKEAIDRFSTIRTKCTDLEKSVDDIRTQLTEIEDDVTSNITRLEAELGAEGD
jgi:hypothetical protein